MNHSKEVRVYRDQEELAKEAGNSETGLSKGIRAPGLLVES